MNAKEGFTVAEARVMALGYALVEAFHLLENGDSIEIIKTGGKAVAIGEPDVELVAYLLNYKED
jgi:hypothetical protein